MTRYGNGLVLAVALALAACSGGGSISPIEREEGQSEFLTPSQAGTGFDNRSRDTQGGAPTANPEGNAPAAAAPAPQERLIEESDVYKIVGNHLFVLNQYRGLKIVDISDLDRPRVVGRERIFGYPREMYIRGSRAYIIVSDYYTYWREPVAAADVAPSWFHGSQLRIVDISDVTRPTVVGGINLEGEVVDSRIVGDVMYLGSNRYAWWTNPASTDDRDMTQVVSVSIADPASVRVVDLKSFPRDGWEHHMYVNPHAMYLASSGWTGNSRGGGYDTIVRYIDIRDPAGQIRVRGEARVPGRVQDRWSMDEYEGVFRVASASSWGNGDVFLTTFAVGDPDRMTKLGEYVLHVNEQLTSASFDGKRGYLVSYRNIDPLFAFDLSDPSRPTLLGELEMTGWLDFMVPMGDRIVALGHEDIVASGNRTIKLAVSLIDVSQPRAPTLLSRVTVGENWGFVPDSRDNFAKVFKVLPQIGLIAFPFSSWSQNDFRYQGGVQLIDLSPTTLTRRGLIEDAGWVERAIPHGTDTMITLSSEVLQVADIRDRDRPRIRARLQMARNVQDFSTLPSDHAVDLSGDWWRGDTQVTVTRLAEPNAEVPVSQIHVPAPYGRLFTNGAMGYVASVREVHDAQGNFVERRTQVEVVDLSDPANPRIRGRVSLPEEVWLGYHFWYWGSGDEAVQVNGSTLAFHRYQYPYYVGDCVDCGVRPRAAGEETAHKIYLVDLRNPDAPRLASTVTLTDANWAWGLKAFGTTLYLSEYRTEQRGDRWFQRYFLRRIDVTDPANPVVRPGVNIPGMFVAAQPFPGGEHIYTVESIWDQTTSTNRTFFHALALLGDRAFLRSTVELPGYINNVIVQGSAAFASSYFWDQVVVSGRAQSTNRAKLFAIDLSNPRALRIAGSADLPADGSYLQKVEAGRAFIGSSNGIFSYLVTNLSRPTFERFFRTQGWAQDILVRGTRAYVPSGYYGVQVLDLSSGETP